ncbi:MAG: hypothetical protein M1840_007000 [Geoglossum simile]|nr:MAG: hypothetical protein M1840_007000 [Geoglossum simile]
MTPFEIALGVLKTVEFGFKVYTSMGAFVTKVEVADNTADDLSRRVSALRNTFLAVSTVLKKRIEQLNGHEPETEAETNVWVDISDTINSWQETVQQFKETIEELDMGPRGRQRSWVRKMLWFHKHGHALPILQGFQNDILSHKMALSLLLQCVSGWEQAHEKNNSPVVIEKEVDGVDRVLSEVENQGSYNSDAATERISRCIVLAQATKNALKGGSTTDLLIEPLRRIENVQYENIGNDVWADVGNDDSESSDSEVDEIFNDTTPRDMAEALIQHYKKNIPLGPEKKTLDWAEYHQRRLLMYAREWNREYHPQIPLQEIEAKLVKILNAQRKFSESSRFQIRALTLRPEQPSIQRRPSQASSEGADICDLAGRCYTLAETYLTRYHDNQKRKHLDRAELFAKRSVALRLEFRHDSEPILQSVRQLVEVVKYQKHSIEADVYTCLYLAEELRTSSGGSVGSSGSSIRSDDLLLLDQPSVSGMTPLIVAIRRKDLSLFEDLILRGVNAEAKDLKGRTPLLHAANQQDDKVLDILIKQGVDIDALCNEETALHYAIRNRKPGMATCLLKRGAGVEIPSKDGFTPLVLAVQLNRADIVLLLCELEPNSRPNLDARDRNGLAALHHAAQADSTEILKILLAHKADPNIQSTEEDANTPLHKAVIENHENSAEILLQYGANVDCEDGRERTPFLVAIRPKNTKRSLIQLLVKSGAKIDETKFNKRDLTPDLQRCIKEALTNSLDSPRKLSVSSKKSRRFSKKFP